MKKILMATAALLVATGFAFAEPRHRDHDVGVGIHVGPGGVGAHVGPLRGGVRIAPEHHRWHRGTYYRALPGGVIIGDPCWRKELTIEGWEWVYLCDDD